MSSPLPPPPPPLIPSGDTRHSEEKKKRPSFSKARKISRNFSGKLKSLDESDSPLNNTPPPPPPIFRDEPPRLYTPPLIDINTKSKLVLQADVCSNGSSEPESPTGSNGSGRKKLRKRVSTKTLKKNKIKEKRPRMMDNTIRLVASMYDNKDEIDPRVFIFDAKELDSYVLYADDDEIVEDYNPEYPPIKGAVIEKLITGLTPENYFDQDFAFAFLLNYRSFTTVETVLELLKLRWDLPMPQKQSKTGVYVDPESFEKKKLKPIRLRIYNVLKLWIDEHWMDIDKHTGKLLTEFLEYISKDMKQALSLINLLNNPRSKDDIMFDQKPPKPYIPMNLKTTMSILDLHPEEIARQMTIIDSNLFRNIKPQEFLNLGWTKPDKETRSPGIIAMINMFNHISKWVSSEIVLQQDIKQRAIVITRFICVAQKCLEYNNINGVMEIVASLQNSAIHRLYNTWELIPQKALDMFSHLSLLMNGNAGEGNFKDYREALKNVVPPVVPYLGLFLTDLTFLNEGNPDFLDEEKKFVNFAKMTKIARVVRNIIIYQQEPYCLSAVEFIQDYIRSFKTLSEEEQYAESIKLEKKIPKAQRLQMAKEKKDVKKLKIDFKAFNISD